MGKRGNAFITIHIFSSGSFGHLRLLVGQVDRSNLFKVGSGSQTTKNFHSPGQ